jgi:hypothetical protein
LAVTGVLDVADAVTLTPAQQTSIGFSCDGVFATFAKAITSCSGVGKSKLLTLPQIGQENDDHNVDRVKPRHVFNLGLGTDNLFRTEKHERMTASFEIANLTNKVALYNFLIDVQRHTFPSASHRRRAYRPGVLTAACAPRFTIGDYPKFEESYESASFSGGTDCGNIDACLCPKPATRH